MTIPCFIDWQPGLEILRIGGFSLRWYSFLWCVGLLFAYLTVQKLYKQQKIADEKFEPLFLYCFFGILIGARLGHCLFYEPEYYLSSAKGVIEMVLPIRFAPGTWDWEFRGYEGLASHGGTIGLTLALILYVKRMKVPVLTVLDNVAIATPLTACCIRLGNLMNSEIIGSPTEMPWGFLFHTRDALVDGVLVPRHPAQLYEALAYLLIFFAEVAIYRKYGMRSGKPKAAAHQSEASRTGMSVGTGFYFGFCLTAIFVFRFFVEFIKKEQVDFEEGMLLDMGQLLSIPFVIIGIYFIIRSKRSVK
ncbi:MAG: prolipoprotein diacylglyceryl transferase [Bacteroides sp.]|nr:prolipoprotein diacylglyceryl transferase [Roseburia sp.]MCM1347006.1 prolipoprotein diacylglyceryl transferase [Bacteroides sp.]MCM1421564.1 prolipoprotein diacylglyceryl transferase [Bacteroides sp.]